MAACRGYSVTRIDKRLEPAHGCSIRQYRHALYDFEKERWRGGETDSHPFDRDLYPPENGKY